MEPFGPIRPTVAGFLFAGLLICLSACDRQDGRSSATRKPATAPSSLEVSANLGPENVFGVYVVADYVRWDGDNLEWAKAQVGTESIISREVFVVLGLAIRNPRYAGHIEPRLTEGDVALGTRRQLSDFWGYGLDRDEIHELEVYNPATPKRPTYSFEIIDKDTVWAEMNGWLFQLRRKGCAAAFVPLRQRESRDDRHP